MKSSWSDIRSFADKTVARVYEKVRPLIDEGGDELLGTSDGGDILARIDQESGEIIRSELTHNCPEPCSLLDEASGTLVPLHDNPTIAFTADEFDGTRPARMKIPTNAICLAAFGLDQEPVLRNVKAGAMHLMTGERFSFERGAGIWRDGTSWQPPSGSSPLEKLRFSFDIAGGHPVLANWYLLPFASSHRYGVNVLASSAYVCSRILVGGIDFYIHLSKRLERDWPELAATMRNWHQGAIGQYAWDLATTMPLMWEAGIIATHTDGSSLENVRIDDGSPANVHDVLVARTPEVHAHVLGRVGRQIQLLYSNRRDLLDLFERTSPA